MTEIIRAYYLEHKTVFNENFQMVLESFDKEAIHKMRTSTKRLRALFILVSFLSKNKFKAKKQLRKIRTLFKFSGKIREIQIEKQLVESYQIEINQSYPEYLEYLSQREHKDIVKFLKHLPSISSREHILNNEKNLTTIDSLNLESLPKRATKFIRRKDKAVKGLVNRSPSNHRIHATRTQLKQLYYLFDILSSLTNSDQILGLNKERLREIEQYLGDWHDLVNSPVYMNAFFRTKKYTDHKKYAELKKSIAEDRLKMRTEIIQNIYPELQADQTAK